MLIMYSDYCSSVANTNLGGALCYQGVDRCGWVCIAQEITGRCFLPSVLETEQATRIDPGLRACAPVFFSPSVDHPLVIGSDPLQVAVIARGSVDISTLAQDLRFGFRLGRSTMFEKVFTLLPGEMMELDGDGASIIDCPSNRTPSQGDVASMVSATGDMLDGDEAFELTGGVDSRLVLALALAAGVRPKLAMTLGPGDSADVLVAGRLAKRLGMRHVVIDPAELMSRIVPSQAAAFVRESGYAVSITSYGWLPALFERLRDIRGAQVTGTGGECSGGFFDSPFDGIVSLLGMEPQWTHARLSRPGNLSAALYSKRERRSIETDLHASVRARIAGQEPYRRRLDRIYSHDRVRQWGAPVLRASSAWYEVKAPLLSDAYLAWSAALPLNRRGRVAQRELIASLCPDLAKEPYASDIAAPRGATRSLSRLKKYSRRLLNLPGPPDLGASETARRLHADDSNKHAITQLVDNADGRLCPDAIRRVTADPARYATDYGFLLTAAIANRDLHNERNNLESSDAAAKP